MHPAEFIAKWQRVELTERAASQEHFLDLCALLGHPTPAKMDPVGECFTFEKGAAKHDPTGGSPSTQGWADVWKKGFFAWEYKGKHKDLAAAYNQLLQYREALENPPLLVVSDMERIRVHTNFTATVAQVHEITLDDLASDRSIEILHALFFEPEKLRPGTTSEAVTAEAAGHIAEIALSMRDRGLDPYAVARFLDRVVFCLFAEDVGLLPEDLFSELVVRTRRDPSRFALLAGWLFEAMADGGYYVYDKIRRFDGNLFSDAAVLELTVDELEIIHRAARLDWAAVSPSIFGTLFERGMDPTKRSQLGAHYTSEEDISTLVEPVVMQPLRQEWGEVREAVSNLLTIGRKRLGEKGRKASKSKARGESGAMIHGFLTRLAAVKVLDPACGSGNFLYVALRELKDLEKEVILFAESAGLDTFLPLVGPWQLYGIEVSPYAFDLAQMIVWIGYLQWTRANGFQIAQDPVLRPMESNFQCRDAILDLNDPEKPAEPDWPRVDFVVGNPPFLGDKLMRRELGDEYVDKLRELYAGRIPGQSDLCCYWFERARAHLETGGCKRVGLLATQGIRGGANRVVLARIKVTGDIFFAESDRPWVLDGANVHVSMVGFDEGHEQTRTLDGRLVARVAANLSSTIDVTAAERLSSQRHVCFIGTTKKAPLDVTEPTARPWLEEPNPNGRPNSDVVRPWLNGQLLTRRLPPRWIIDYPMAATERGAAFYAGPFAYVTDHVKPLRQDHREAVQARFWWRQARPCPDMRGALGGLARYAASPRVSKHRIIAWVEPAVVPDCQLIVFARADDYFFGVLHSRLHQVWALSQGTQLRERESGFRYTPTTCFETFPLPWPPGQEPPDDPLVEAIAAGARELEQLRATWLNPPEWTKTEVLEFPGTVGGPWDRYIVNPRLSGDQVSAEVREAPDATAWELAMADRAVRLAREDAFARRPLRPGDVGLVRYPRTVPRDAECARKLKKRTLTNLYNERPAWLDNAHRQLDEAVCAAYVATTGEAWPVDMSDEQVLGRLLALNLERTCDG